MKRTIALATVATVALCLTLHAQTPAAAATQPATPPPAPYPADPILFKDPAQLTTTDIKRLQTLVGDFANLARYRDANKSLPPAEADRVVFFGDSITDAWHISTGANPSFPNKPYINRGIGGQTTSQMVLRYQQDVIDLKPAAVLILAGTNDIAGNTGVIAMEAIEANLRTMAELAQAHGIKVILASVLPVDDYPWRRGLAPADKVRTLNTWIKQFCTDHGYTYLDYYTALATPEGGMKPGTARDGVHPTPDGYAVMAPLAQAAIDRVVGVR